MRCLRRKNYNGGKKINNRNSNIDMIRIVAMLLVVALHCMDYGGFIKLSEANLFLSLFVSLNHTISICAVNCFALISGYLLTDGKKRWNKLAGLWVEVCFYSAFFAVLFNIVFPKKVTLLSVCKSFFPISTNQYWYFTAYVGLFFLMPTLNAIVTSRSEQEFQKDIFNVVLLFSLYAFFIKDDIFFLNRGFSVWWLAIVYILGAGIKKYRMEERFSRQTLQLLLISDVLITSVLKLLMQKCGINIWGRLYSYNAPNIIFMAVVLFMLFLKIDFKIFFLKEKGLRILSSATFGVYLIHNNNYFNDLVFKNIFINVPTDNVIIFILCFYFSIASVYATCTVIELLRIRFFCVIKGCFVLASKTKSNLLDN